MMAASKVRPRRTSNRSASTTFARFPKRARRFRARSTIAGERSTPVTSSPASASGSRCRPGPQPRSPTEATGGIAVFLAGQQVDRGVADRVATGGIVAKVLVGQVDADAGGGDLGGRGFRVGLGGDGELRDTGIGGGQRGAVSALVHKEIE